MVKRLGVKETGKTTRRDEASHASEGRGGEGEERRIGVGHGGNWRKDILLVSR